METITQITPLAIIVLAACAAIEPPGTTTEHQQVTADVPEIVAATSTFTASVATMVRDGAAARGLAVATSAVQTGYSRRNTLGSAPASGGTHLVLIGRSFVVGAGVYGAGLYQLVSTSRGVELYHFGTAGRTLQGLINPPSEPAHSVVEGLCGGAPSLIKSFCEEFVACALYDQGCPGLPPVYVG